MPGLSGEEEQARPDDAPQVETRPLSIAGVSSTLNRAMPGLPGASWGRTFRSAGFGSFFHSCAQPRGHAISERPHLRR